jgi:hypothetical protein
MTTRPGVRSREARQKPIAVRRGQVILYLNEGTSNVTATGNVIALAPQKSPLPIGDFFRKSSYV